MLNRKTKTTPRATWREHFLDVARRAGEPLSAPAPAAFGLRPRAARPGLGAFARPRAPALTAAA